MIYRFEEYCKAINAPEESIQLMRDYINADKHVDGVISELHYSLCHRLTRDNMFLIDMMCLTADLPFFALDTPQFVKGEIEKDMSRTTVIPSDRNREYLLEALDEWVKYLRQIKQEREQGHFGEPASQDEHPEAEPADNQEAPVPDDTHPGIAMTVIHVNCRGVRKGRRPHSRRHKI